MTGGHNMFFTKGYERYGIPALYFSDATQGVHIRNELENQLEKSTAFPCPLALAATWNTELAYEYAKSIGEECRAGGIAVLLGPGMNIYRISQNGRNFEYFGEDPFLAARMIENYVTGVQSTGTMATLKHFLCNNTDFHRRRSNSVVDDRTLHEIYLPAFKAGIDAGAMAVMTAYNQVNGEWAGQSDFVINGLLRNELGFKWLVMSDWWSAWDPAKAVKAGLDLDMPGHPGNTVYNTPEFESMYVRTNAKKLVEEGKISAEDIHRMVKNQLATFIAMGLLDRPVKDTSYLHQFEKHEQTALQTAREAIVLLKNTNKILPVKKESAKKILLTGEFAEKNAAGGGSAYVEGYNRINMLHALQDEFGGQLNYRENPSTGEIKEADIVLLSIGTSDNEGWDRPFALPDSVDSLIINYAAINPNVVVIVNSGSGIQMTEWYDKIAAIIYAWYPGQTGNRALAEILSGKVNPSGKLPITIERQFEDSPGYPYIPEGKTFYTDWKQDNDMTIPVYDIEYNESVFVGYRWYESQNISPLFPFGFGLSYTKFDYSKLKIIDKGLNEGGELIVEFTLKNTGEKEGAEIAQLYLRDEASSVLRPEKELKRFEKVFLKPGESKKIKFTLSEKDLSFWDELKHQWKAETGSFKVLVGASSADIRLEKVFEYKTGL
ncbi:MAG: glycoside hydrolase family 3 C-terminal domain-containing protein [Bacteroidales bacterium]|nr:glycoside hydrolase family 3 C-terminal domain-containing protein [Bacteroidales bacterium]